MLSELKKFWRFVRRFIFARVVWCLPGKSNVLIYDGANKEIFLEFLNPWDPEVLHVRGEQINMRVFLRSLFKSGGKTDAYVDCYIEEVQPKLVVTLVDNAFGFYSISARNPDIRTLLIQNGIRSPSFINNLESISLPRSLLKIDYMMPFGSSIGNVFSKYIQGSIVPMGSILNNSNLPLAQAQRQGVIAFISQWNVASSEHMAEVWRQAHKVVIQFLIEYAENKNKRLIIIPRSPRKSDLRIQEEDFLKGLFHRDFEFFDSEGFSGGYRAVDSSDVVVALDSTLGHESIARGNKTGIFSILSSFADDLEYRYGWPGDFPDEGLFWTNNPDCECFNRIMDYLFEVDDLQWKKDVESSDFSSIMKFDPGNKIFRETIEKILGAPPTFQN